MTYKSCFPGETELEIPKRSHSIVNQSRFERESMCNTIIRYVACVKYTHVCCIMSKTRKHFDFHEKEEYLRNKTYPSAIPARDYGSKSNFRRAAKCYELKDGHLFYKKRLVIKDKERQMAIIRDMHRGIGDSEHSKAITSHRGKNTMYDKIAQRFFWA